MTDIAPDFKRVLAVLPVDMLIEIKNHFQEALENKKEVSKADKAILKSFQDELDCR